MEFKSESLGKVIEKYEELGYRFKDAVSYDGSIDIYWIKNDKRYKTHIIEFWPNGNDSVYITCFDLIEEVNERC